MRFLFGGAGVYSPVLCKQIFFVKVSAKTGCDPGGGGRGWVGGVGLLGKNFVDMYANFIQTKYLHLPIFKWSDSVF